VFFASLAGNYLGQIDLEIGTVAALEPWNRQCRARARGVSGAIATARSGSPAEQRRSLSLRQ
jgi:hypothetical protein